MPPPWPIPRLPRLRRPDGAALRRNGPNPPAAAAPDPDLVTVLEAVTSLCDRVVDALESDRAERAALVDALTRLATALEENRTGPRPELPGERVLGGTIGPITAPAVNGADSPPSPAGIPPTPVEVRSGLEGRWVEGFEVCDTVRDAHGIRYRLRRLVDRVVLPELFAEEDVRRSIRSAEGTGTTPPRVRRWSPF